jgi:hypothetical protein
MLAVKTGGTNLEQSLLLFLSRNSRKIRFLVVLVFNAFFFAEDKLKFLFLAHCDTKCVKNGN